jgi:hypothetical protein
MILFGLLATCLEQSTPPIWPRAWTALFAGLGIALALYVFMIDARQVAGRGTKALRQRLPVVLKPGSF